MIADRAEPWRLWILLSAPRGTLGREIRYGWTTIEEVRSHADVKLHGLDLRAEDRTTGERWNRVRGTWRKLAAAPGKVAEIDLDPPPGERPRYYWEDRE